MPRGATHQTNPRALGLAGARTRQRSTTAHNKQRGATAPGNHKTTGQPCPGLLPHVTPGLGSRFISLKTLNPVCCCLKHLTSTAAGMALPASTGIQVPSWTAHALSSAAQKHKKDER